MFDDFIDKYKYWIGGGLIIVIIGGFGTIGYYKYQQNNLKQESEELAKLKQENEMLRQELSGQSQKQVAGATLTPENKSDKININTADAAELDKIPSIGPARAMDIINYRESHGGFKTIEEMKNIKGIGDKTFEAMKDLITVGG